MCFKSYFKEIVLKLAINGQSDKGFLLTSAFVLKGVCYCSEAIYVYKSIKIYTRTRYRVSVYKTTGPLVITFCTKLVYFYFAIVLTRQHLLADKVSMDI